MGSTTLTSTWAGPGINNVVFLDDATGLPCVVMGNTPPTVVTIENLESTGYSCFSDTHNSACGFTRGCGSFSLAPNEVRQFNVCAGAGWDRAIVISTQNVGPGIRHIRLSWPEPGAPCAFGTRIRLDETAIAILTPPVIAAAATEVGAEALIVFLNVLSFFNLNLVQLCGDRPPPVPVLTNTSGVQGFQFWLDYFRAIAWPHFCECVPGTPAPAPFPPPVVVIPPNQPAPPAFPCDPAALCGAITSIGLQLQALEGQNASMAQLLTLLQRYALPFAYLRGRRFSTLTATGSQELQRCVGLLVEVTQFPPENKRLLGAPEYIFDLGWVSVLTPDGMLDEIRLTRQATTWLSKLIPSATTVGWGLRAGVTVEISELLAEP